MSGLLARLTAWWHLRPVLRAGEVITFYDHTRTIPRARMVVAEFHRSMNAPAEMRLVDLSAYLQDNKIAGDRT